MACLGYPIDIEGLVARANTIALVSNSLTVDHMVEDERVLSAMYDNLTDVAAYTLQRNHLIAMIGEYFIGASDPWNPIFTDVLRGDAASLVGRFAGVSPVYLEEPVELDSATTTHLVPALEFDIHEVELDDAPLGAANLYSKVAVPLLGQITASYTCSVAA